MALPTPIKPERGVRYLLEETDNKITALNKVVGNVTTRMVTKGGSDTTLSVDLLSTTQQGFLLVGARALYIIENSSSEVIMNKIWSTDSTNTITMSYSGTTTNRTVTFTGTKSQNMTFIGF